MKRIACLTNILFAFLLLMSPIYAQESFPEGSTSGNTEMDATRPANRVPFIDLSIKEPTTNQDVAFSVQLLLLLTLLAIAPSILLLMTSFLRLSIVLDFVKRSLSLQQVPPTQVLNGIALFLTIFIMKPVLTDIYNKWLMTLLVLGYVCL